MASPPVFSLKFSHNVIEHLGLKLYQNKPTNVIAELVSNSWDANATKVFVNLYATTSGTPESIIVSDNGLGMDDFTLINNYLVVGKNKRQTSSPDEKCAGGNRSPMGRKGIGKLAPFGVAKTLNLITIQNNYVTWLKFNYDQMSQEQTQHAEVDYKPEIIYYQEAIATLLSSSSLDPNVKKHLQRTSDTNGHGTIVHANQLTLTHPILPEKMRESLGRRFTVTLARPDFIVHVNDEPLSEAQVFPEWELRIPATSGTELVTIQTPFGEKEIRYWVGFVKDATWPSEQSGVGIYAHGKIAQDRPFFFENKGNEIFTRYLYAVIEADWIDEQTRDFISTDRTSIDWNDNDFQSLKKWGNDQIKSWIKQYKTARKQRAKQENTAIVDKVLRKKHYKITSTEQDLLVDLLCEITPSVSKNLEDTEKLVEITTKAWIHEPARKLIKKLWEQTSQFESSDFLSTLDELTKHLVPESLSLAVVFSQRVYALTQLKRHLELGNETQLQKLIETFPWILHSDYEKYYARKSLITTCREAEEKGFVSKRVITPTNTDHKKPDFVFLGDTLEQNILIVELKGPRKPATSLEDEQLNSYQRYLQSVYTQANVKGILIAGSFDDVIKKQKSVATEFITWDEILLNSRKEHMNLLAALLVGTEHDRDDTRVKQICELGGEPVREFLQQMSENSQELKEIMNI